MRSVPPRLRRLAAPLLLIGLLLVPLVASGHQHGALQTAQPCATCIVAHHAPAVSVLSPAAPVAVPLVVGIEPTALATPREPALRQRSSRGPPDVLLLQQT